MAQVTTRFGAGNSITLDINGPQTPVRTIVTNPRVVAGLALPQDVTNLRVTINGIQGNLDSLATDGSVIDLTPISNVKG